MTTSHIRQEWSWIRRNPVAAFTSLITILGTAETALGTLHILNGRQLGTVDAVVVLLTVILGAVTHKNTTSLVKPKDEDGTSLVPVTDYRAGQSV